MDKTPELLKIIEPHLPKPTARDLKIPGGIELYLNNREWRLLTRSLRKQLHRKGSGQ